MHPGPAPPPQRGQRNPQTLAFLDMLGLPYNLDYGGGAGVAAAGAAAAAGMAPGEALTRLRWLVMGTGHA